MSIESEIFKRKRPVFEKMIEYGFVKDNNLYKCSKKFMDNNFRTDIIIDLDGTVSGKVYDLEFDDEYTNFRMENQTGEFVNTVREEYQNILKDIAEKCYKNEYFVMDQSNRITKMIKEKYNDDPEFAWDDNPMYGIFRNPNSKKWYGLIMNIDKSKIDKDKGEIEIINVKLDEEEIINLLKNKGYYPAYHMNKKNWITIILDDTLSDIEIMDRIMESHKYTETSDEWIVPANPKYYDIIGHFNNDDIVTWKQSSDIHVDDIVYMYVGEPYSAILYKCRAIEVNIPYSYNDDNLSMSKVMKLKLLKKYKEDEYTFKKLNEYGIRAIRGPRFMPKELSTKINKNK